MTMIRDTFIETHESKPSVMDYENYREFLKDSYLFRKAANSKFSFQFVANRISATSSYLKNVMEKRRHISLDRAVGIAQAFELDDLETDYFILLAMKGICTEPNVVIRLERMLSKLAPHSVVQ